MPANKNERSPAKKQEIPLDTERRRVVEAALAEIYRLHRENMDLEHIKMVAKTPHGNPEKATAAGKKQFENGQKLIELYKGILNDISRLQPSQIQELSDGKFRSYYQITQILEEE